MQVKIEKSSFRAVAQLVESVSAPDNQGSPFEFLLFLTKIGGDGISLRSGFHLIADGFPSVVEQIETVILRGQVLYRSAVFRQLQTEREFRLHQFAGNNEPDKALRVYKQIFHGIPHSLLLKDGVQIGNVSLAVKVEARHLSIVFYP